MWQWLKNLFKKKEDPKIITPPQQPIPVTVSIPPKKEEPKPVVVPIPPWMIEAEKHRGKKETDSTFNKWLSGFWGLVGLKGFTSIIGSSRAWCGLFIAAMLYNAGLHYQLDGATSKNWDKFGVDIYWKNDGIPYGSVVRINHQGNCKEAPNNHVSFAKGSCAPADLLKKGATITLFGGNQNSMVKDTDYPVSDICSVKWPADFARPPRVTKSVNCSAGSSGKESTR